MHFDEMIKALEGTGDYRVLRRLVPRRHFADAVVQDNMVRSSKRRALFIDVETTGLDVENDEIIELAMVPVDYEVSGRLLEVLPPFQSYREPSIPIPPEVTELTGIDADTVKGHVISADDVVAVVEACDVVIAHNAEFDRKFAERFHPLFEEKPWACSMKEIDWKGEGFESCRLGSILHGFGFFHDAHRALDDCLATIEILSLPLPRSGSTGMVQLLASSRKKTCRVWADRSPFSLKDVLKKRGYEWSARQRTWFCDISEEMCDEEVKFLKAGILPAGISPRVVSFGPKDRYSVRVE